MIGASDRASMIGASASASMIGAPEVGGGGLVCRSFRRRGVRVNRCSAICAGASKGAGASVEVHQSASAERCSTHRLVGGAMGGGEGHASKAG